MPASVSGKVIDYFTGRPVAGATVTVNSYVATTDANGNFYITNIQPASYSITVIHRNYEAAQLSANLAQPQLYTLAPIRIKPIFRAL